MNILYVILTCDAYYPTRCRWQKETWIPHVKNHVFLGARMNPEQNMVGWDTTDDYHSCPVKVLEFMRHYCLDDYDWVVFVDDDTFVFPERLEPYLATLDKERSLYVGTPCNDGWVFMSGGAGFAVSAALVTRVRDYISTKTQDKLHVSEWSDKTFGHWVHEARGEYGPEPRFRGDYNPEYFATCFTCHYVKEDGFRTLAALLPSPP